MFLIIMGVAGSGKTSVGRALAEALECPFYDGDDFHPPENIAKMAAGVPLDDDDRAGWLAALAALIGACRRRNERCVIACSALKESYRQVLRAAAGPSELRFVYLQGDYATIWARMQRRCDHFMRPDMLSSQFAALEEPVDAITVDVRMAPDEIVQSIMAQL